MNDESYQQDLVLRACAGDRHAFEALLLEHSAKLRNVIRRMVGHREDTEDLMQESFIRAWENVGTFRAEAGFGTWLCAIGIRQAIDHLRQQKRWRARAQIVYANECYKSEILQGELIAAVSDPAFTFEAGEHIAYCFTCVGRSLEPEDQAVLVLREVLGMTNQETATALDISESVVRHRLTSARRTMQQEFEDLCSLVNKDGVCYQCKGLRDVVPESQQGPPVPALAGFDQRLAIVREANIDNGASQAMHDLFWRRTKEIEDRGFGSAIPESECGPE